MIKPLKILILSTTMGMGGADQQILQLATRFQSRGYKVYVVTLLVPNEMGQELQAKGIYIESLGMQRGLPNINAIVQLTKILRNFEPDILYTQMFHASFLGRITRLFSNVPVLISNARNINEGSIWRQWAYRLTDSLADLTTQNSQAGYNHYIKIKSAPKHKITFMPNVINTNLFEPNSSQRKQIRETLHLDNYFCWLAIAGFRKAKDYPNLLKGFAKLIDIQPHAKLLILGQGPLKEEIETLIKELQLEHYVNLLGVRRDICNIMNAADAFVMSSAWEGTPNVLLEAHAVGLPIVATDVGGNSEVIINHKTGFIVPPKNPAALFEYMNHLMNLNEKERQLMGSYGREHIKSNYEIDSIVEQWEKIFQELLNKKLK